jgi:phage host-nuclease inhibitor protein Gam
MKTNTTVQVVGVTTAAELAEVPATPEGFSVKDERTANWLIRKVIEARRYAERAQEWAAREVRRAQGEEKFLLHRYGQQLEDWVRRQLDDEGGRRKSLNLPAGTVGFRIDPQRLEVTDEQTLIRWCRVNLPSAIAVSEQVIKSVVREHVVTSGELADGAEIVDGAERFFLK